MTHKLCNARSRAAHTRSARSWVAPQFREREQHQHREACRKYNRAQRRYALRLALTEA